MEATFVFCIVSRLDIRRYVTLIEWMFLESACRYRLYCLIAKEGSGVEAWCTIRLGLEVNADVSLQRTLVQIIWGGIGKQHRSIYGPFSSFHSALSV